MRKEERIKWIMNDKYPKFFICRYCIYIYINTCINICGMRVEWELFEEKEGLVKKGEQRWRRAVGR